jgi:hypothetical protein
LSNRLAFLVARFFETDYLEAYQHPEDVLRNVTEDLKNAESGHVQIAKVAYENPLSFLTATYHNATAGAEEFGETAPQEVKAPTQATAVAAQLTMMIFVDPRLERGCTRYVCERGCARVVNVL